MLCYLVKMLPTESSEHHITFLQDGESPARSVFLSHHSRARCNVPYEVLAIAHANFLRGISPGDFHGDFLRMSTWALSAEVLEGVVLRGICLSIRDQQN